jgi:hypothetical protein
MVGAGIFALLGEAAAVAGAAVWLSFLLAGVVAALLGYTVVKRQASGRRPRTPSGRAARGVSCRHRRGLTAAAPRARVLDWTDRAATRRWLQGKANREATHELLASTLEHVLRTFGAHHPRQGGAHLHLERHPPARSRTCDASLRLQGGPIFVAVI